ncbi:hypothetical protein TCAL_04782 [Tigriopus californicus]|uniref:Peroxidase n=1 Tax=Tigriopus californicus TaxID=6832 RepID=A0A553PDD1_TIGCA|nr:peroxidasin-like [Tigriopus californicus]TRY75693.1 hypothetical protein TCAL_04782 [Tigriopus californicus]|eukprot:TCALIF_04782-PA protein Name:"Similar to Pxn Peroxidasin (Drosophila melanogaster)" AED:0.04 eAED:0.04 QI:0/0/0/0.5/1/1/2/0/706
MNRAILVLSLFLAFVAAIDIDAVAKEATRKWEQEQEQKVLDGLTTPISKRRKVTDETKAMKRFNSLVDNMLAILKTEEGKEKESLSLIADSLSSSPQPFLKTSKYSGDNVDIAEICKGVVPRCGKLAGHPFRTLNGVCNNLDNPRWGSILTFMRRWRQPAYQDGHHVPRGGFPPSMAGRKKRSLQRKETLLQNQNGLGSGPMMVKTCSHLAAGDLPNPRLVSRTFHPDHDVPDKIATHMVAIMGQFLDHDVTLTPEEEAEGCCFGSEEKACFPIQVDEEDPFFHPHEVDCLDFTRSLAFCEHFFNHREQINGITAFVDASNVYGSTKAVAHSLRTLSKGLMKISTEGGYEMLPIINGTYHAGDIRALENPALTSMHTLFLREHNRIAEQLYHMDPSLDDEEIYQRTRRIVSAEMQNVVYGGYLPVVLGSVAMDQHDLGLSLTPSIYNPSQDPSISNVFATAAYRFGHSMIQGIVDMVNEVTRALESGYKLQDNFFNPAHYLAFSGAGMEKILAGLVSQHAQTSDQFVVDDVTNHLFPQNGAAFGSDLVARNIQRGRDHGLASYNAYREFCGRKAVCTWEQKPADISSSNWETLKDLYNHPNDIDVFVGGLAENPYADGLTGHTFQCIKSKQFQFLKYGDRYFFTHANQAGSFEPYQISNLLQRTLGDIICDNTKIAEVRTDVFKANAPYKDCQDRTELEIERFKEL